MNRSSSLATALAISSSRFALVAAVAAIGFGSRVAPAQTAPSPSANAPHEKPDAPGADAKRPPRPPHHDPVPLSGQVQGYNYSPRGTYDGLLLSKGDKVLQINFPPDTGSAVVQAAPIGQDVQLTATPEMGQAGMSPSDHPVYNLDTLTGKGDTLTVGPGPGAGKLTHVDGVVKQLNYGHRGEVDGVVLDSGDFIHVGGPGAASLNLAVGQKLSVDGRAIPMPTGHNAIEADTVNGTDIPRPAPPHGGPDGSGPPHPPEPNDAPLPPPGPDANQPSNRPAAR